MTSERAGFIHNARGGRRERFSPYRPLTRLPRVRRVVRITRGFWSVVANNNFGGWYVTVPWSRALWHVGRQPIPSDPWEVTRAQ